MNPTSYLPPHPQAVTESGEKKFLGSILLRKRAIVETIIDQLKNISQVGHSRHRSPFNSLVNLICGMIAYLRQPKKPSLGSGNLPALIAQPVRMLKESNLTRTS